MRTVILCGIENKEEIDQKWSQKMEKTLFNLDEANALIPFLTEQVMRLKALKAELDDVLAENEGVDVDALFKSEKLTPEGMALRQKLQSLGDEINDVIFEIQDKGAVVKDLEQGLVDFFCELKGETVFLCWKLGEPEIRFWHGVNEGFGQRKSLLERQFLECVTKLH
jgi:hypothetical protein